MDLKAICEMSVRSIGFVVAGLVALVVALTAHNVGRHFVFWSPTEEIVFVSGDIRLAGTLIKPAGAGVFSAVVILHSWVGTGNSRRPVEQGYRQGPRARRFCGADL